MAHVRERIDPSELELKDTVVSISRVTKVVKGGKNLSFSALVVIGDGHGVVGFGTGIIAGGAVRAVVESAGIHNVLTKSLGSANPHNVVRAAFDALGRLKDPAYVARLRGKDVEELVGTPAAR